MHLKLAHIFSAIMVTLAGSFLPSLASAQPSTPQLPTPPPMRFVARDERSQLTTAKDAKARVRLSIELAEARLTQMEESTAQRKHEETAEALGGYLGLVEDVMKFIGTLPRDKNSTRDLYRRLDLALRAHLPRLAVMRRETPSEHAIHLKAAEEFTRDTRSEALEIFYGNTVLREPPAKADANKATPRDNKRP
jgi:hypothetical protein